MKKLLVGYSSPFKKNSPLKNPLALAAISAIPGLITAGGSLIGRKKRIQEQADAKAELEKAKQDLKDIDKPELTSSQLDDIYEAIESGVDKFDWNDTDNFEIEYGINYDGKVNCDSHEFRNSDDLV